MKNPHGVEPTRYMKRKESRYAIRCHKNCGPRFGNDICISDNCNNGDNCYIQNDGTNGYDCHKEKKKALFVNTAGYDEENKFSVSDYEVFGIDYENRDNIYKLCKHPDIIWEYIETKDISDDSLKQVDEDTELLSDLDAIYCNDSALRVKISKLCLKNPSELLGDTQLVNQQYDVYLREWLGSDYQWKVIYRASNNRYTGESFHGYCDDKGPTLIIIKSSGGWIFGGYTTKSWKAGESI